jgi:hypothetical protein
MPRTTGAAELRQSLSKHSDLPDELQNPSVLNLVWCKLEPVRGRVDRMLSGTLVCRYRAIVRIDI